MMWRLRTTTKSTDGEETYERAEPLDEWQAARELAAEQFIHTMDGWTVRAGIGRLVCWKGTTERTIEARKDDER